MAKGKRKVPGINASSTADISFILLIFFLVVTSMNSQEGLHVTLPRKNKDENQEPPQVKQNNVMQISVNSQNKIMVIAGSLEDEKYEKFAKKYNLTLDPEYGEYVVERPEDLKQIAKDFISNKDNLPEYPTMTNVSYTFEEYDDNGKILKEHRLPNGMQYSIADNHVISLTTDRGTSYSLYFKVLNELYAAYNELKDEMADDVYKKTFSELEPGEQGLINMFYKYRIYEADPVSYEEN